MAGCFENLAFVSTALAVAARIAAAQTPPTSGSGAPPPPPPPTPAPVDATNPPPAAVDATNPPPIAPMVTVAVVTPPPAIEATVEPVAASHAFVSAKVGGIAPFDGLSPFVSFGVELGVVLPAADRRLAIVIDVDYTQPTKTGGESDPRVMGGTYSWKLTEQELAIMPVLMLRLTGMRPVIPYGGIGPRILLARSTVQDNGAPSIMQTHEQSTRIGIGVPLVVELPAAGRLIGELLLQYGTLDHTATGDANTAAVSLSIGYRILF